MEITGAPPTLIDMLSRVLAKFGATLPNKIPPRIHKPTQTVRYRSNQPLFLFSCLILEHEPPDLCFWLSSSQGIAMICRSAFKSFFV